MDITETPHGQTELNLLTYLAPHPDSEIWVSRAITPTTIETLAGSQLEGCTVFLYVREGSSSIDIDGVTYNTSVPSIIYLRPGQRIGNIALENPAQVSVCTISIGLKTEILNEIQRHCNIKTAQASIVTEIAPEILSVYDNLYNLLIETISDIAKPYYHERILYIILFAFFEVGYHCYTGLEPAQDFKAMKLSKNFIVLVDRYHRQKRFLDFYAERLGVSSKHLSRTVKRYTGIASVDWIEHYTISDAKILLRTTNLSIKEIAERLNFSSQSFFGKYFKKYEGISPKDFRRRYRPADKKD